METKKQLYSKRLTKILRKKMHYSTGLGPVCLLRGANEMPLARLHKSQNSRRTINKENVTCKKCKASPQFLIHNFNSRFGIE